MNQMVIDLPDINVWLSLIDSEHSHHTRAKQYWENEKGDHIAFIRVTMLGLFRLGTHPKAMKGSPFTIDEMWASYDALIALPETLFLSENQMEEDFRQLTLNPQFHHNHWTDAYLASVAKAGDYRLITFDKDFKQFRDLNLLLL